ncbi:MAG: hypothetical protein ACRD1Y_09255, partial [Terriglobales bacterium]
MRRVAAILGVTLALALLAAAQARPSQSPAGPWVEVHSPNFEVYCHCDAASARNLAGQMERMRQLFHQLLPALALNSTQPLEIVAVRNWKELHALAPAEFLRDTKISSSIYQPTEFLDFILLRRNALDQPGAFATIYHEYTHYMVDRLPFPMPVWLNEGLAEFLQTARIESANADLGATGSFASQLLHAPRLMPLRQLFAVGLDSPYHFDQEKTSIFYTESWAVVHYLMLADLNQHSHRLQDYLTLVRRGEDPTAAAVASFGGLDALQRAATVALRQANPQDSLVVAAGQSNREEAAVKLTAEVPETAFHATPLTEIEGEAIEASVLAHGRRYADADAMAQRVLRRDPGNELAEQVRGLVAFRRHEFTDARIWLRRAVTANPSDVLAAVLLTEATLRGEKPNPAAAAVLVGPLQNATRLRPDFAPAFDLLAQMEAMLPHRLPAATAAEARAIALEPGEWAYRWNAATLQFNAGNLQKAIRLLRAAERRTDSPARVGQCREAILQAQGELDLQAQTAQQNAAAPVVSRLAAPRKAVALPPPPPLVIRGRVAYEACPTGVIASLWLDLSSHGMRLHFDAGKRFSWRAMVMPGQGFDPCRDMTGREVVVHAQDGEMSVLD